MALLRPTPAALTSLASLVLLTLACSGGPNLEERGHSDNPTSPEPVQTQADFDRAERSELVTWALADARSETPDLERRARVVERLRSEGPVGLDALLADYRSTERDELEDGAWRQLIDEVAQQRDASYGGMFWYRDLETAKAAAAGEGKPILSLRLLGELTSEFSCANSRLFRTVLYADPELASWLESNFVLHWSSERPVPKMAIDFGDGRVVQRTITGNSAHFVLDARGRSIDVIPGLMSASAFRGALQTSLDLHTQLASIERDARWRRQLAQHHQARFDRAAEALTSELARTRQGPVDQVSVRAWLAVAPGDGSPTPAIQAVPMAVSKAAIEAPILGAAPRQLGGKGLRRPKSTTPAALLSPPDDLERSIIGSRLAPQLSLHPNTLVIIDSERPVHGLVDESERSMAYLRMQQALVASIQQDTAKNVLELHPRVNAELARRAESGETLDFELVDRWLYSELFETPADDPWLGLIDPSVYTGLEGGGVER